MGHLNVGSLFTGIGGIDLGLERAGLRVVFQAESDEYRRRVLAARFPGVWVYADVREVAAAQETDSRAGGRGDQPLAGGGGATGSPCIDVLCGGFP